MTQDNKTNPALGEHFIKKGNRLLAGYVLLLLALIGYAAYFTLDVRKTARMQALDETSDVARILALIITQENPSSHNIPLLSKPAELQNLVDSLKGFEYSDIEIINAEKKIIADVDKEDIGKTLQGNFDNQIENILHHGSRLEAYKEVSNAHPEGLTLLAVPVEYKGAVSGALIIDYSTPLKIFLKEADEHIAILWLVLIAPLGLIVLAYRMSSRVREANRKIELQMAEMVRQNNHIHIISQMNTMLQACVSVDEAADIICRTAHKLLQVETGGLYLVNSSLNRVSLASGWGDLKGDEDIFSPNDCWALRLGSPYLLSDANSQPCNHLHAHPTYSTLCIPIIARGDVLAMLHLRNNAPQGSPESDLFLKQGGSFGLMLAESIGLALSNLKLRRELENLSVKDPLTGLFNRRYMDEAFVQNLTRAKRNSETLAVFMIDLDHFKLFNDTHGHAAGDLLLKEFARLMRMILRESDIVCRFGGEEFCVILPSIEGSIAQQRAEDLLKMVQTITPPIKGQQAGHITISIGIALYPDHGASSNELIEAADKALYEAKKGGRNRSVLARQ